MKANMKFSLVISSFIILMACHTNAQQVNLPVAEFEKSIAQNNIQVLDVRTAGEYQSGHLKNALQADWNNQAEFQERVKALDKNKTVYTYCLSGGRSSAAAQWLKENGFTVYNLAGGIAAWKKDNKPVEQAQIIKQITVAEYYAQIPANKTVLVDFGAEWCPPCRKMNPLLDSLVATNGKQFTPVKIDGAAQTDLCREMKIDAFPTFILYKKGKEVWRKQGLVEAKELVALF